MSCGVGCRCSSDPALLWLWRRLETTAPIQPLAWEPPHAAGAAQEIATTTKKTKKDKKKLKFLREHIIEAIIFFLLILVSYAIVESGLCSRLRSLWKLDSCHSLKLQPVPEPKIENCGCGAFPCGL